MIYYLTDYLCTVLDDINCSDEDLEALFVSLNKNNHVTIVVVTVYWPPSGNVGNALRKISEICDHITKMFKHFELYVTGNLNINLLINSPNATLFSEICGQFSLFNLINVPTRISYGQHPSLLDICVTNSSNIFSAGTINYNISDHLMTYTVVKGDRHNRGIERSKIKVRSFKNYDVNLLTDSLKYYNWGKFYGTNDVDEAWNILFNQIVAHANYFAPYVTQYVRTNQPGWFSTELLEASIERDRLFASARSNKDKKIFNKAKKKRNEVKTLISNARSSYYIGKLNQYSKTPKKFWWEVNNIAFKGRGNDKKIRSVVDPDTGLLADSNKSTNIINEFFVNIGEKLDSKLPIAADPCTMNSVVVDDEFICEDDITVAMVMDLIKNIDLSKSSGCPNVSARIYKDCLLALGEQLTFLFNLSIRDCKIPKAWKHGMVTPLPKKGDITQTNNIRPITQTHICGKMLERIISNRLTDFFEDNDLFYPEQMGFRKKLFYNLSYF